MRTFQLLPAGSAPPAALHAHITAPCSLNVLAPMRLTSLLAPAMVDQGAGPTCRPAAQCATTACRHCLHGRCQGTAGPALPTRAQVAAPSTNLTRCLSLRCRVRPHHQPGLGGWPEGGGRVSSSACSSCAVPHEHCPERAACTCQRIRTPGHAARCASVQVQVLPLAALSHNIPSLRDAPHSCMPLPALQRGRLLSLQVGPARLVAQLLRGVRMWGSGWA